MQIVLRHVQIRVTHHALDRRQVHAQRLKLTHIGVSAGMRRQNTDSLNVGDILLEFVPIVFGVEGLFFVWRLEDVGILRIP